MSQARLRAVRAQMQQKETDAADKLKRRAARKQRKAEEEQSKKKRRREQEAAVEPKPQVVMQLVQVDSAPLVDAEAELQSFAKVELLSGEVEDEPESEAVDDAELQAALDEDAQEEAKLSSVQNEALSAALFVSGVATGGQDNDNDGDDDDDDDDDDDLFQDNWTTK